MPWRKGGQIVAAVAVFVTALLFGGVAGADRGSASSRRAPRAGGRSRILRGIAFLAVFILGARIARHIEFREVARALASASIPVLFAAAGVNLIALALQAGRWLAVVHPVDSRARPRDAFFALVAGYAVGLIIPARASDLARAHLLSRRTGGSAATLTTTAVVDHLLGSVALLAVIGVAAVVWPLPAWIRGAGALAAAVAITILAALWIVRPRKNPAHQARNDPSTFQGPGQALSKPVPEPVPGKPVGTLVARLRRGLAAVGSPRAVAVALAFAVAGWLAEGLIAHLSLRAFGLPSEVAPSMMAVLATTLSAAISVSPGNAGAFEIACVAALGAFGVPREAALAFAIGYHCVHLIPTAVIGGGWLIGTGFRPAMLRGVT